MFVPKYDWQAFLSQFSKPVKGIKQFHYFSFSHQAIGVVMATTHAEGLTQILPVLVGDAGAIPHAPTPQVQSPGLSAQRQWYLFKNIRDFCTMTTPRTKCVPNPQCLSLAPHHQQDTGKKHFLRVSQILKVVVMPLPEARVVVGEGVVVVVRAEDRGEDGEEGEVHKGNQTQTHHLHWRRRRRRRKSGEKWTLHHHPSPGPDHQPNHQGHRRIGVGASVLAVQREVRPPDRLCYCDYYYLLVLLLHFSLR